MADLSYLSLLANRTKIFLPRWIVKKLPFPGSDKPWTCARWDGKYYVAARFRFRAVCKGYVTQLNEEEHIQHTLRELKSLAVNKPILIADFLDKFTEDAPSCLDADTYLTKLHFPAPGGGKASR